MGSDSRPAYSRPLRQLEIARSEVRLDRFVYNPDRSTGQVTVEASRGVFRFVTGSQDPKSYAIKTPIATIGVRGTEFHLLVRLARHFNLGTEATPEAIVDASAGHMGQPAPEVRLVLRKWSYSL